MTSPCIHIDGVHCPSCPDNLLIATANATDTSNLKFTREQMMTMAIETQKAHTAAAESRVRYLEGLLTAAKEEIKRLTKELYEDR